MSEKSKGIESGKVSKMADLVNYQEGSIVSRIVMKQPSGNVTLFAFDAGEALSEHKAPYDALVQVIEGEANITLEGQGHQVTTGEAILLPANVPHAVEAITRFKMLLTMLKA
jgi:quercetin dioxygenase-like cupin family protein